MDKDKLKELISKLSVASSIIGNLPELPGYNGSILTIDDIEAENIEESLDYVIQELDKNLN